jgi:LysR family cyn operon transcriptional activator
LLWRRDEARTPAARSFASIVRSVSDSESRDTRRNTVRAARR